MGKVQGGWRYMYDGIPTVGRKKQKRGVGKLCVQSHGFFIGLSSNCGKELPFFLYVQGGCLFCYLDNFMVSFLLTWSLANVMILVWNGMVGIGLSW